MNNNKNTLQRRGALLLATVLCISAMAGCGTATQKKTTEKTPTQQSQQITPKADSGKKDAGKKTSSGKTTGSQSNAKKPGGSQSNAKKPGGSQSNAKKPGGSQTGTSKPASSQTGISKPADKKEVPSFKTQPQSVKVAAGSSCKFTVSAIGANLKYVWQVDKNDGKGWTDIPDANESTYTVQNAAVEQNGWKFRCVVINDAGKAESAAATLNVESSVKPKQG